MTSTSCSTSSTAVNSPPSATSPGPRTVTRWPSSALLTLYRVIDPVKTDVPGVFRDPELQQLYDELVAQGSASLKDAIEVGITIEKLDISDLKTLRAQTSRVTIKRVYTNLTNGSYNHLAAFNRADS